ncbi:Transcription initiation factor TFIID subunit 7 [Linum perenne]
MAVEGVMEEQFILRVPPSVAESIERLLNESASNSEEQSLDLSFSEDGRSGTFSIGDEQFPASLLDLPCIIESFKTYDDCALVKTADIGQMIMVRGPNDSAPDTTEYRHGLTPPMRDARKRRFRREPDLNPELVQRVERDLLNIMAANEPEDANQNAGNANKKTAPAKPVSKPEAPPAKPNAEEPERSDSDESEDSM